MNEKNHTLFFLQDFNRLCFFKHTKKPKQQAKSISTNFHQASHTPGQTPVPGKMVLPLLPPRGKLMVAACGNFTPMENQDLKFICRENGIISAALLKKNIFNIQLLLSILR